MDTDQDQDQEQKIRSDHIDEDVSERFNSGSTSRDLSSAESGVSPRAQAGIDQLEAYANDPARSVKEQEASGSLASSPLQKVTHTSKVTPDSQIDHGKLNKALAFAKKNKGFLGLTSLFGVSGALLAIFFGPASMIINLTENLSITNDTSSTSFERRFLKVLQNGSTMDPLCASKKLTMKCSTGVLSEKAIKSLNKKGITPVIGFDSNGQIVYKNGYPTKQITAYDIDLGDGKGTTRVARENVAEFFSKTENRKYAAKVLGVGGAMNLRVRAWAGKYIYNKFYNKFGLRLNGGIAGMVDKLEGTILNKLASYRSKYPDPEKIAAKAAGAEAGLSAKIGSTMTKVKKAGTAYTIAVAGCLAVKAPSLVAAGVAAIQLAQILPPVMDIILSPGSMAKAAGSDNTFTAEGMDVAGTALTEQTARESDGKMSSALDSVYLLAALGVNKGKSAPSAKYTPGFGLLTSPFVVESAKAAKASQPACTTIMSPTAMYGAMAADMAITVAASATIVGGLIKIAAGWAISEVASKLTEQIISSVGKQFFVDLAKNKDIPNAKGEALGDVLGIGAAAFFAGGGMSRHLPVLTKKQLASASNVQSDAIQFEKEMDIASLSPLDTSSRYTFLGSIVHNLKFAMLANGSYNDNMLSIASNILRLPQMAMAIGTQKAGAADVPLDQQCDYAKEFGLDTGDPATTPAINMAGLPCTSYTESQVDMSVDEARDLMIKEGWLDENVDITMSDNIQDLVRKHYIKADTPLYDVIEQCSDPSTGDYLLNAAGCTVPASTSHAAPDTPVPCGLSSTTTDANGKTSTVTGCATNPTDAGTSTFDPVDNARSMEAINVFLGDYQMIKQLNGEDEGTGTVDGVATSAGAGSATGQVVNGFAWIVDKKWYDDPASHYGLMKGHQANSGWYFQYPNGQRYAMDMSPSNFIGTPVYALTDGVVHTYPSDRNATFYISSTINGKQLDSLFAHGQNITVKDGDTVKAGQQVMEVGSTGNSAVPHIHWELRYDNSPVCGNDILNNLANNQPIVLEQLNAAATPNCLGRT